MVRPHTLGALLVLLLSAKLGLAKEQLTLEAIFGEKPLEGALPRVTFLPDGTGYALVQDSGETKVFIAFDWEGRRRELVRESELQVEGEEGSGIPLAQFQFSPDGKSLLLKSQGDLFLLDLATKRLRRLTRTPAEEELASFSPDSRRVAFVRENDLYLLDLDSGAESRLTEDGSDTHLSGKLDWVYTEELYNRSSQGYAWSPDSRFLLYLTFDLKRVPAYPLVDLATTHPSVTWLRYPKAGDPNATVCVVGQQAGDKDSAPWRFQVCPTGPRREYVARFGWLPDTRGFWVLFLDRAQRQAELVTFGLDGKPKQVVLQEQDDAWINVEDDILWTRSGSLLFGSERSGFRHLYRLDPPFVKPVQLTSGDWEVTEVMGLSADERFVYFVATEASPLERQLYRVPVAGGKVERLTQGPGTHSLRAAAGCRAFLDLYSTATQLPEPRLLRHDGKLLSVLAYEKPPRLENYLLGQVEFFTLKGPSGDTLYASLLKPADFDLTKRYPVVVYVYGGPHAQVVRNGWGGRTALFHHFLASEGFLVFSLDNRGSAARGRAFERALLHRFGERELEDQLAGVQWLAQQPFVDSTRIGIWGWSYGGFLTLYALTHSQAFAAGAAVAPVTDWRLYDTIYTERYLKLPNDNPQGYEASSPISAAANLSGALLLAHGTGDDNVHWQNTLNFVGALTKAQKPYTLLLYPNKDHGIPGREERLHLFSAIARHFRTYLKPETPAGR